MPTDPFSKFLANGRVNVSGFDGTIETDFLKLGGVKDNRKADLIDYAIADFEDYRVALQNYLRAVYPLDYDNFSTSDLGQMLIELFAYMAAAITLRTDMTANEMYLDTVKSQDNLRRLLRLIGVEMRGPTSAKATGKITLNTAATGAISLSQSNRVFTVANNRDSGSVVFTVYKQNANGGIDLDTPDLQLDLADSEGGAGLVYNNLFLLEGTLRSELGTFASVTTQQEVRIDEPSIIEGSISVSSSEGVIYNEIQNLFLASGTSDPVFQKRYLPDFGVSLTFGDGNTGRLPAPNASYIVSYRVGGGSRGNIAKELLDQNIEVLEGSTRIQGTIINSTKGSGGAEAESVAKAKRYAPNFFKAQYRAVTGEDYTTLANTFIGTAGTTAKAMATLRKSGAAANVVDIFVLAKASDLQVERASIAFKKELQDYFKKYKMLTDEVVINDGVVRTIDINATLFIDSAKTSFEESIKQKVANKLTEYFNVDNRDFGQSLSLADVIAEVISIPEVRFFRINNIPSDIFVNYNELIQLNNFELQVEVV
jgi:hypothetical protein